MRHVTLVDAEFLGEPVDQVIILGILDNLQDGGDQSVDFGTGPTDDNDVLRSRRILAANGDGGKLILAKEGPENTSSGSDNVSVPFLRDAETVSETQWNP